MENKKPIYFVQRPDGSYEELVKMLVLRGYQEETARQIVKTGGELLDAALREAVSDFKPEI